MKKGIVHKPEMVYLRLVTGEGPGCRHCYLKDHCYLPKCKHFNDYFIKIDKPEHFRQINNRISIEENSDVSVQD